MGGKKKVPLKVSNKKPKVVDQDFYKILEGKEVEIAKLRKILQTYFRLLKAANNGLEALFNCIYKEINFLLSASRFFIVEIVDEGGIKSKHYLFCVEDGIRKEFDSVPFDETKKKVVETTVLANKTYIARSLTEIKQFFPDTVQLTGDMPESSISIPLIDYQDGKKIAFGCLVVQSKQKKAFSKDHLIIIRTLAFIVSQTVHMVKNAMYDLLTGLENRRSAIKRIKGYWKRHIKDTESKEKSNLGLMIIDGDHFKRFNDLYGHEIGDEVLKFLSGIIKNRIRSQDIACRWGGEEFIVVITDINEVDLAKKANSMVNDVNAKSKDFFQKISVAKDNGTLSGESLSVSIGYVHSNMELPDENLEDFIKAADDALYEAKKNRNCCCSYSDIK